MIGLVSSKVNMDEKYEETALDQETKDTHQSNTTGEA